MERIERPMATRILRESLGKLVFVWLKGNRKLRGKLEGFDQHMNLYLTEAEEVLSEGSKRLGNILVRGDNVILISPCEKVEL